MSSISLPTTADTFVALLEESRLLSPDQLAAVRQRAAGDPDPRDLARKLVRERVLTMWQARNLLAGGTSFFLGRYKLLERLGAGGRAKVYKAEQAPMGRIVAIKVLDPALLSDAEAVARWKREIRLAAALNHPAIITAVDSEQVDNVHFMVMEYVEGRDLKAWVDEAGPLPVDFACECIKQAAAGLYHAHTRGVVHRDIKAGNILVVAKTLQDVPQAKLLDMGFARFLADEPQDMRLTQPWQTFGTPEYMAPEQGEAAAKADHRSDIFSLGCTLFKLLTAEFPFGGLTTMQKLMARANNDAKRVRSLRPDVPQPVDDVVAKMLARRPEDRYQSALEVAKGLAPFSMVPDHIE